jgi:OOP family OmpA-OmpF porin
MVKKKIMNIIRIIQAISPMLGNALKSGQLFRPQCELTEPDPDRALEKKDISTIMEMEGKMMNEMIERKRRDTMEKGLIKFIGVIAMLLPLYLLTFFNVQDALSLEALVEEETVEDVYEKTDVVQIADNVIILFDSSSSMSDPYNSTGIRKIEAEKKLIKERIENTFYNNLNVGLYSFSGEFRTFYEMQPFNTEKLLKAIDNLPEKGSGPTMLGKTLRRLEPILNGLSGRTVVFLFSDGSYTKRGEEKPVEIARQLARKYNVNFQVISTTDIKRQQKLLEAVASINESSRVIPFEQVLNHPEYYSGAVFAIEESFIIVKNTSVKIVALKLDDLLFGFDSSDLKDEAIDELDKAGKVLVNNPKSYIVLAGFTDDTGAEEYNLGLSRRRVEAVGHLLAQRYQINKNRIILHWYGEEAPVVSNKTASGRLQNRRILGYIGGLD